MLWGFVALLVGIAATFYFVFLTFLWGAGYQPTPRRTVEAMLRLAEVREGDRLVDLGAGTGAVLFRAADRGASVLGVEVEPVRVLILRLRRRLHPARERIVLSWGNLFDVDLRSATVVAVFLWPDAMRRLRPRFESQLAHGSRVVSHYHPLPGYAPDAVDRAQKVYLYRWPPAAESAGAVSGGK